MKAKETAVLLLENHAVLKDHQVNAVSVWFRCSRRGQARKRRGYPGGIPARGSCRSVRPGQVAAEIIGNSWQIRGSDDP